MVGASSFVLVDAYAELLMRNRNVDPMTFYKFIKLSNFIHVLSSVSYKFTTKKCFQNLLME